MITKISSSPLANKRYRVFMDDGKHYDFGLKNGSNYLDHKNLVKRENYRKRHLGNATEKRLIENLVPSPSTLSFFLLWGKYTDLDKNISYLNNLWKKKHG